MITSLLLAVPLAALPLPADSWPEMAGGYCVATGYCTSGPGDSGRPAGPMYLAIGLVGAGLAALRRERQA
jgi:MYXO-CTERM domain-containing protein